MLDAAMAKAGILTWLTRFPGFGKENVEDMFFEGDDVDATADLDANEGDDDADDVDDDEEAEDTPKKSHNDAKGQANVEYNDLLDNPYPVGTRISKLFAGRAFEGLVTWSDGELYEICYEDGDEEVFGISGFNNDVKILGTITLTLLKQLDLSQERKQTTSLLGKKKKKAAIVAAIKRMVSEKEEPLLHLAKDGKYYATYQEKREANIRVNMEVFKSKGLDDIKKSMRKRPQVATLSRSKKRSSPAAPSEIRRSNRKRRKAPDNNGLDDDWHLASVRKEVAATRRRKLEAAVKKRLNMTSIETLSEENRKKLENLPDWTEEMENFLIYGKKSQ